MADVEQSGAHAASISNNYNNNNNNNNNNNDNTSAQSIREQRKRQVILGDLAPDFLRIQTGLSGGHREQYYGQHGQQLVYPQQQQQQLAGARYAAAAPFRAASYAATAAAAGFYQIPSNAVGRLVITINQAKLAKNYGLTRMDPYCRIMIGHHVFETPTAVNGAKNPRWCKTFALFLPSGVDSLSIEIFNEMTFAEDDRIAWNVVQLPASVFEGVTWDDWLSLSGRQGDEKEGMLHVVVSLEKLSQQQQQQQQMQQQQRRQMQQQQQQVIAPAVVTDADISALQEMFPDTDTEVIKSVLEAHNNHREAAAAALLQMGSD